MTAERLLKRVRTQWRATLLLRSLVAGLAAAACLAGAMVVTDIVVGLPWTVRRALDPAPAVLGLVAAGAIALRLLRQPDDTRFALLAQERVPALGNALATAVTAVPAGSVGRLFTDRLDATLAAATAPDAPAWLVPTRIRTALFLLITGVAMLAVVALAAGGPSALLDSWRRPAHEAPLAVSPGSPLGRALSGQPAHEVRAGALRWTAAPPAYTGMEASGPSGEEPIRALAGSRIVAQLAVAGPAAEWSGHLIGGDAAAVEVREDRVISAFRLATGVRGLELVGRRDGEVVVRRVVPIAMVVDAPPDVELEAPHRDEVLAAAAGVLTVRARATDDHRVASLRLGWIRSRGSGESFAFEEGESAFGALRREGGTVIGETGLDLAGLDLGPGDVLHVRAIATDANDVTGPGVGVSTTRVIRIAAEGEEHEVTTLIGAPADVEERPVLSQRMIILMTERLIERLPELSAGEAAAEAARVAREQGRLRARVGEILFVRSTGGIDTPEELSDPLGGSYAPHGHADHEHVEGDEDWDATDPEAVLEAASRATGTGTLEEIRHVHDDAPVIAVNRELLGAYNAMHDAERALRQVAPDSALPPEYRALEILQSVREGERVFARGRVSVTPVDVAAARGTGELTELGLAGRSTAPPARDLSASAALDEAAASLELPGPAAALAISDLTARLLAAGAIDPDAAALLSRAATAIAEGRRDRAAELLGGVRARLEPSSRGATGHAIPPAADALGAAYHRLLADPAGAAPEAATAQAEVRATGPFTFATARYASGNWDSAPLVPTNLTHSLAQYTGIDVAPDPVIVDLASDEVFDHPFLFLTGHLPVRFTPAESRNLRAYVERGGFVFMDDHNHDIDAAFHRTAMAELDRIFGPDALQPLPNDHEIYTAFFRFDDGPPTTTHELNGWGDGLIHEQLHAITVDGRIGLLYSNKDYASEWNYHAVNKRFQALDNTRFGVNVLVYALTR